MKGVVTLGEVLIDFIPIDNNMTYQKNPGGAPANVAAGVSRLGGNAGFIGKVGNDSLGRYLKGVLDGFNVSTKNMIFTEEAHTGIVLVTLDENGERSFEFYVNPSADSLLREEDIKEEMLEGYKILHFGTISMISEGSKKATIKAIKIAKEKGMYISFDPNLRLNLWENEKKAKDTVFEILNEVDILKVSDEEIRFLTGKSDIKEALEELKRYDIKLILVTLGKEGVLLSYKGYIEKIDGFKVEVVDTTGAGDAFIAGILYAITSCGKDFDEITIEDIKYFAKIANVCGACAVSKKGAMSALPTLDEVLEILKR
ncbi:aminoimidazole riboside kinase [Caloramator sp. mosi_1]|uniref:aminoimidazole riboside kinase n=1 Tax=Caloramator sp. mosi_1 TaxID=3023090 RepID=UPI0023620539|nr:aminoimidazole riboside kinase [Caloramator sp. mosi_1]WDC84650.1 aminoimidazole riboside kinase [Caloramator sp. mosi_1]